MVRVQYSANPVSVFRRPPVQTLGHRALRELGVSGSDGKTLVSVAACEKDDNGAPSMHRDCSKFEKVG